MTTPEAILAYLDTHENSGSKALCEHLGISRQALNFHLNRLIDEGRVVRTGATRNTRYVLPGRLPQPEPYRGKFGIDGLDETRVYQRLALSLNLAHVLQPNAETVFQYVFTEMLNNAIYHSGSKTVRISGALEAGFVRARVVDGGIGVFVSIARKLGYRRFVKGTHVPSKYAAIPARGSRTCSRPLRRWVSITNSPGAGCR